MPRRVASRLPLACAVAFCVASGEALAGAWTLKEGEGQAIVTGTYSTAPWAFDAAGNLVPVPDYDTFEAGAFIEYGVTDRLTAILQPRLRAARIAPPADAGPVDSSHVGPGHTDLGARFRLWENGAGVFSAQLLGRFPGAGDEDDPAQVGHTDSELDARLLFGYGFEIGGWHSFVDLQGAYRVRFGDPADEVHADLTFGLRPHPRLLLLAQSFNVFPLGEPDGIFEWSRYRKLQMSGVWSVTEAWSLQLGGIATVAGENALRERGVLAAVWRRF